MYYKQDLDDLIVNVQKETHRLVELLSNKFYFLDSVDTENMDTILDELTPFYKCLLYDFIAVYNMEGITIARGDSPDHFGMSDSLYPYIMKAKEKKTSIPLVTLYDNQLLLLELKRLDAGYGPIGFLAVGQYLDEKVVNNFSRSRLIHLAFQYEDAVVVSSTNFNLPETMDKKQFEVEFATIFGQNIPFSAILWKDTSKSISKFWNNLFIVIITIGLISFIVIFFSRRIIVNTVNALYEARISSERELVERKKAQEVLKQLNDELEERIQARTQNLEDEIVVRKQTEQALLESETKYRSLNKDLELRVRQRTVQLEEVNKELEDFVYSVSHDLRAPLRSISGFAEIIDRRHKASLSEEGQHYFDNIVKAGRQMGELIDDLLKFSSLGRKAITSENVSLEDVFKTAINTLSDPIKKTAGRVNLPEQIPDIQGDVTLASHIFINLLENALKYHQPNQPPVIDISFEIEPQHIVVCVADNGIGIAPEHHEKIFNIFQRLHSLAEYPGTGIGLAAVKKAVQIMGGRIWVESEPGKGSVFRTKFLKAITAQTGKAGTKLNIDD